MKADINDQSQILSHALLENRDIVKAVASTEAWINNQEITVTVQFNGIDLPAEVLEETLKGISDYMDRHYREKYNVNKLEALAEARAVEIVRERAGSVLDKMSELTYLLEDIESMVIKQR